MASQTIKIPDDDFKCLSQSNIRYHRVFQTSRANNNDLLFPRSKKETICIIDVALIYNFDSYSFPNLPNGIYLCYLYFAIFHSNNVMFYNIFITITHHVFTNHDLILVFETFDCNWKSIWQINFPISQKL